jgi:hypothetical protein
MKSIQAILSAPNSKVLVEKPLQPVQLDSPNIRVFFIDKRCLEGGALSFANIECDTSFTESIGLPFNPTVIARTFGTFQEAVVFRSIYGVVAKQPTEYERTDTVPGKDGELKEVTVKVTIPPVPPGEHMVDYNGVPVPRVQQYIETVRQGDSVIGWMVFMISMDPQFSFDLALSRFFKQHDDSNKKKQMLGLMKPAPNPLAMPAEGDTTPFVLKPYTNKMDWTKIAVSSYSGMDFWQDYTSADLVDSLDLIDPKNPASTCNVFTLERALEWRFILHGDAIPRAYYGYVPDPSEFQKPGRKKRYSDCDDDDDDEDEENRDGNASVDLFGNDDDDIEESDEFDEDDSMMAPEYKDDDEADMQLDRENSRGVANEDSQSSIIGRIDNLSIAKGSDDEDTGSFAMVIKKSKKKKQQATTTTTPRSTSDDGKSRRSGKTPPKTEGKDEDDEISIVHVSNSKLVPTGTGIFDTASNFDAQSVAHMSEQEDDEVSMVSITPSVHRRSNAMVIGDDDDEDDEISVVGVTPSVSGRNLTSAEQLLEAKRKTDAGKKKKKKQEETTTKKKKKNKYGNDKLIDISMASDDEDEEEEDEPHNPFESKVREARKGKDEDDEAQKMEDGFEDHVRATAMRASSTGTLGTPGHSASVMPFLKIMDIVDSQGLYLAFPNMAFHVFRHRQDPAMFFNLRLDEFVVEREIPADPIQRMIFARRELERLLEPVKAEPVFETMAKAVEKSKDVKGLIKSNGGSHMLQATMARDVNCPGVVKNFKWFSDKRRKAPQGKPSFVRCVKECQAPFLTFLGNMMALELDKSNFVAGVFAFHVEFQTMLMAFLLVTDILNASLRAHFLLSGPAASGKSFMMKTLIRFIIPGCANKISKTTAGANTTDMNFNGEGKFMDEILGGYQDRGNPGHVSELKEMLSDGTLTTHMCIMSETDKKKRMMSITVSQHRAIHVAGMNDPFARLDKALASRFGRFHCPHYRIKGRDPVNEGYAMAEDLHAQVLATEYEDEWHQFYFLSALLCLFIRLKVIPQKIDTTIVRSTMMVIVTNLRLAGYQPDARDIDRIYLGSVCVCIFEALCHVFRTNEHFADGTPFEFWHVLECTQYLYVKREHVWIALGQYFQTIVNPFVDLLAETFHKMIEAKDGDARFATRIGSDKSDKDRIDFDYYFIDMTHLGTKAQADLTSAFCSMVTAHLHSSDAPNKTVLGDGNVIDAVDWLFSCKKESMVRYRNGAESMEPEARDFPKFINLIRERRHGKMGMEISREFLRSKVTIEGVTIPEKSYFGLLQRCIYDTFGVDTDLTKHYITGTTFRDVGEPSIYRTVKRVDPVTKDAASLDTIVGLKANPRYQFMIEKIESPLSAAEATLKMVKSMNKKNLSLDEFVKQRWLKNVGHLFLKKKDRPMSKKFTPKWYKAPKGESDMYNNVVIIKAKAGDDSIMHNMKTEDSDKVEPFGPPMPSIPPPAGLSKKPKKPKAVASSPSMSQVPPTPFVPSPRAMTPQEHFPGFETTSGSGLSPGLFIPPPPPSNTRPSPSSSGVHSPVVVADSSKKKNRSSRVSTFNQPQVCD